MASNGNNTNHLASETALSFAALGVVFGDIGTSPLYALKACFHGMHSVELTEVNVLGVLSLITWSLILVISVKYLLLVMRADNDGEGGILALTALVARAGEPTSSGGRNNHNHFALVLIGLFGAALLYGDGIITPAISVLSAVEGLDVATPVFRPYIVPLTIVILTGLFFLQSVGTQGIGSVFGPIMLVWFAVLAVTGLVQIVGNPAVLAAVDPTHAVRFFHANNWTSYLVLGVVFLVVTGGEALYADMGHFGKRPIRIAWFALVLPALLLNYFGQGALILGDAHHAVNPFYHMVPGWLLYPMVCLATIATVIASQAIITGAFSLTMQAIQLGFLPRLEIRHTSESEYGQVYIPVVNVLLYVFTVAVVFGFGSSERLASAYGVAVTTTMVITTLLAYLAMRKLWQWNLAVSLLVTLALLVIDLSFFLANMAKFFEGGWFPLVVAALVFTVMTTWQSGRELLRKRLSANTPSYKDFLAEIDANPPVRIPGTEIHLSRNLSHVPTALTHNVKHNRVMHKQVAVVGILFEKRPFVRSEERVTVEVLRPDFFRILICYGFLQRPNVPRALTVKELEQLRMDPETTIYVLGRETLIPTRRRPGMAVWREWLFAVLSRNAFRAADYFHIPLQQVLEIGTEVEL